MNCVEEVTLSEQGHEGVHMIVVTMYDVPISVMDCETRDANDKVVKDCNVVAKEYVPVDVTQNMGDMEGELDHQVEKGMMHEFEHFDQFIRD